MINKYREYRDKFKKIIQSKNRFKKIPNFIELLEKGLDKELSRVQQGDIPIENLPINLELRKKGIFRDLYDKVFPVSHVFQIDYRYNREFLSDFMPISNEAYLGRGSYKLVYHLPWNQVLKVGKSKFYSDPLFGSLFREVEKNLSIYLKPEELQLSEFLQSRVRNRNTKEAIHLKFVRLGLERLHYWKVKTLLPDLVLPTKYFMGIRYRSRPFLSEGATLTPCDRQILLAGKHLKEFVNLQDKVKQNFIADRLFPKWKLNFDSHKFERSINPNSKKLLLTFIG